MKKSFVLLLIVICAVSILFSASAEPVDFTGEWFGVIEGSRVQVALDKNGNCLIEAGSNIISMKYEIKDETVYLDENWVALTYDGTFLINLENKAYLSRDRNLVPTELAQGMVQNLSVQPCNREDWEAFYRNYAYSLGIIGEDEFDYGFFKISWDPVPNADRYYVFFIQPIPGESAGYFGEFDSPWPEYCCALFQTEDIPIYVYVDALDQNGNVMANRGYSTSAYGVEVLPDINLKCEAIDGHIHLEWTSLSKLPKESIRFEIYRRTGENTDYVKIGESDVCSYDDTEAEKGIVYSYRVRTRATVEGIPGEWYSAFFEEPVKATIPETVEPDQVTEKETEEETGKGTEKETKKEETKEETSKANEVDEPAVVPVLLKNGLVQDEDGVWRYYENGEFVSTKMCLVKYGDDLVYVADGLWATKLNGLWDDGGHWYLFDSGVVQKDYTGLYKDTDKSWWLIRNGMADFSYDGLYCDQNAGWVLLLNGRSAANYSGLYYDKEVGWWLVQNGQIASDFTGLWYDSTFGWWLVGNGRLCNEYNGLWYDPIYGWWLIKDGTIDFGYTGLYNDPACGWWLIANGQICFDYVGLWNDPNYGWWLIDHGTLASYYTGLWNDPQYGWWLIDHGCLASYYTGLWNDPQYGWWLVGSGRLCDEYNGLWNDSNVGWWLINNGTINWSYTGPYDEFGATWNIINGQLIF